jgi:hypothetical protein
VIRLAGFLFLLAALGLSVLLPPARGEAPPPPEAAADKKDASTGISLRAGDIIAIVDSTAEALRRMPPKAWVLTPEAMQELRDEIARLRKQLERVRPLTPSRCLLKGKVEGNLVTLQAQYEFVTEQPGALVALGGAPAHAAGASLDGRMPALLGGARTRGGADVESFSVRVEKPGNHQLTLDLLLLLEDRTRPTEPVATGERPLVGRAEGFALELPRAAITELELDLPAGTRDVRLAGRPLAESLLSLKNKDAGQRLAGNLGARDRLDLAWLPRDGVHGPTVVADSTVSVRFGRETTTEARLTLQAQGGLVGQWRLLVPLRADLRVSPEDQSRVARIDSADQKDVSLRTIHLKEPSAEPLTVTVSTVAPAPPAGSRLTVVGPFSVLGAVRHSATVLVNNALSDLVPEFHCGGELVRRDLTVAERRDPTLVAAFRSASLAALDPDAAGPGPAPKKIAPASRGSRLALPWLEVNLEPMRGQMKTRIEHELRLSDGKDGDEPAPRSVGPGQRYWRLLTTVQVTPRQADVDRLVVQLPAGWEYVEEIGTLPDKVRHVHYDRMTRQVEFKLQRGPVSGAPFSETPALKPFKVTIEALYPLAEETSNVHHLLVHFPQVPGTQDEGGEVRVRVPGQVEILAPGTLPEGSDERSGFLGLELVRHQPHELDLKTPPTRRMPRLLELTWRAYRPEIRLASRIELTLSGQRGSVRHEIQLRGSAADTTNLTLRIPPLVKNLQIIRKKQPAGGGPEAIGESKSVRLTGAEPLVLEYSFPIPPRSGSGKSAPSSPGLISVPLVAPEQAQGETRVFVWGGTGELPVLVPAGAAAGGPTGWAEQALEEVAGHDYLPALVVKAERLDLPLVLRLGASEPVFTVLAERVLAQVTVEPDAMQQYRVRYRLRRLANDHLELELPVTVPTLLKLQVRRGGKKVEYETLPEADSNGVPGRFLRLRLPPMSGSFLLEVSYQLSSVQVGAGPLWTVLSPPVIRGAPGGVPTRWQVVAPADWVLLTPEAEQRSWGVRGWLWAPRLNASTTELERWLAAPPSPAEEAKRKSAAEGEAAPGTDSGTPVWGSDATEEAEAMGDSPAGLVCWREGAESLVLTHVPQQTWLLLCSLIVLLLGLGLGYLGWSAPRGRGGRRRKRSSAFLVLLGLVILGAVIGSLLWPTLMGQVAYGCQPGILVLLLVAGLQWLLHERRRRQVLFLPSFSRTRAGSSMVRNTTPRPSTGEAPRPAAPSGTAEPSTVDAPQPAGSSIDRRGPSA